MWGDKRHCDVRDPCGMAGDLYGMAEDPMGWQKILVV